MIFLTKYYTASTTETTLIDDIKAPQYVHMIPETFKKVKRGMSCATHKLIDMAMPPELAEYLANDPALKTGFIFAAGNQTWLMQDGRYGRNKDSALYYELKLPMLGVSNIYAGRLATRLGITGHVSTDASACASSLKVLMDVQNLIDNFGFDRVVVTSAEEVVGTSMLDVFTEAGASLRVAEGGEPSAFDDTNGKFYLGQGAVTAVFEKEHAQMCEPAARLLGAYTASERNTNPLSQREDGQGFVDAIEGALCVAKLTPDAVRLVKSHGTGTPVNNVAEKTALLRSLPEFVATSYKPTIGHTMGASGLLETALLLDDIKSGYVPPIKNRTVDDDVFLSYRAPVPEGAILSLAAGMGGVYSAAIFTTEV